MGWSFSAENKAENTVPKGITRKIGGLKCFGENQSTSGKKFCRCPSHVSQLRATVACCSIWRQFHVPLTECSIKTIWVLQHTTEGQAWPYMWQ